ncbi:hypothetical protein tinsulaeT_07940 [Thalassotalea insulae]|uniref:Chitin-binding type-3 domain-containing protein n=1 Tax=Thalassotalea insulae TaxID=2056778 RepID=A0ABQ6GQK2_9GAMM|nr:lytic polysaccharide monooxygenase [Thalassotalea insulae]GLX77454.1 hypothetical protein tinsulaeT_07940 [Thalassotalea insulae]
MKKLTGNKVRQALTVSLVTSGILCSLASVLVPVNVSAHAYMEKPKARQAICQAQGGYWWPADGSAIPNRACRAAFIESGYVQFVQEHEISVNVADYLNQEAVEAAVPDGTLCSAGSDEKRGLNLASEFWQKTVVTPNEHGKIQVRFNAKTPHNPSYWQIYLSKPSFNASTDVLHWQDLELVQEYGNIDFIKDPDGNRYYNMEVSIPADRSGDALLYSRWQRNDVVGEGFYNCSDITIIRDDGEPDNWQALDYFVKQGHVANVDDTVWLRLFNPDGQELINQHFLVTLDNVDTWQSDFAGQLNSQFSQLLRIGVKDLNDTIAFDNENIFSNQVWSLSSDNSFALSIIPKPDNTAPIVQAIDDQTLDENSQLDLHVHAFDDQNDPLTYHWQVPEPLSFSGEGSDITLIAGDIDNNADVTVSVAVSDGKLTTSMSFKVTIIALSDVPVWSATQAYNKGDRVSYQGQIYQAKWWNQDESPATSSAWFPVTPDNGDTPMWNSQAEYQGGDKVSHQEVLYQAKWWNQNAEPGVADVWQKL